MEEFFNKNINTVSFIILGSIGLYFTFGSKAMGWFLLIASLAQILPSENKDSK